LSIRLDIHVLVIADKLSGAACAAIFLPATDYAITVVHTGAEGRHHIQSGDYSIVVVVVLAASSRQKACLEALDKGVTFYLIKDTDGTHLDALPLAVERANKLCRLDLAKHLYLGTQVVNPIDDNQARFRDFTETASDFFWEMDADLRFSFLSERFTVVSGVPAGPILGRTREEIGCPPGVDPEAWDQLLRDSLARKPITNFEMVRSKPDGQDIHLSISANPVFDDEGNFQGYRGTGTDVTDLAHAQRMISEKHDLLLDAIECIPDGLALFDAHERLIIANSHYRRMFPRALTYFNDPDATFEDFLFTNHKNHPDLAPEVDVEECVRIRLENFRNHKSMKRQMPSGEWILSRERPTTSGGTISVRTDITELVMVTQRADENQALLVNALEAAPDGFAVYDKDDRLVVCNDM